MALSSDGWLYINVGSFSDNCDQDLGKPSRPAVCPETQETPPRGSILRAKLGANEPLNAAKWQVFARGLRNSMALVVSPKGQIIDAVNARDAINAIDSSLSDNDLPHDTLDYLVAGADYGWPYCFDNNRPSPEYPSYDCSKKTAPDRLLPPHAAPLGMLIYHGHALPNQQGHLIIGYHGYRDLGHRIVSLPLDKNLRPSGEPQDLVWGWGDVPGNHPMGSPVALAEMPDGSLLVTEDRNGTLLKIAPIKP
jgi:glucose/arabinose dehydrogenase